MGRKRIYTESDVVSEAKLRILRILDIHDTMVVAYSGGKDSMAVLQLVREVYDQRGIKEPIKCWFRDEEVIPSSVVDWVKHTADLPWVDMEWWAVPLKGSYFVMGQIYPYTQWDPAREWIRPKPEWALTQDDLGIPNGMVLDQYSCDEVMASRHKGKVAILNGMRTAESVYRLAALFAKRHESHICASPSSKRVTLCKPVYDWLEMDVLKYLYDRGEGLCPYYDHLGWSGDSLRVATAINVQNAKRLDSLASSDPELYERVLAVFPQMAVQARYFKESVAKLSVDPKYTESLDGVRQWVRDFVDDPESAKRSLKAIDQLQRRLEANPAAYPLSDVLGQIRSQGGTRPILPVRHNSNKRRKK